MTRYVYNKDMPHWVMAFENDSDVGVYYNKFKDFDLECCAKYVKEFLKDGSWTEISFKQARKMIHDFGFTDFTGITIPNPKSYNLTYRKPDGKLSNYKVLGVIGKTADSFTAYCAKRGVRAFKLNRVVKLIEI